ncbi:hypothetical protein B0O99DRAFT_744672 [Bisporella sp. PMI_857]|nr:hypothetical protein B0O99DRAFT_744672 [Bisporella sp. PMI_857]
MTVETMAGETPAAGDEPNAVIVLGCDQHQAQPSSSLAVNNTSKCETPSLSRSTAGIILTSQHYTERQPPWPFIRPLVTACELFIDLVLVLVAPNRENGKDSAEAGPEAHGPSEDYLQAYVNQSDELSNPTSSTKAKPIKRGVLIVETDRCSMSSHEADVANEYKLYITIAERVEVLALFDTGADGHFITEAALATLKDARVIVKEKPIPADKICQYETPGSGAVQIIIGHKLSRGKLLTKIEEFQKSNPDSVGSANSYAPLVRVKLSKKQRAIDDTENNAQRERDRQAYLQVMKEDMGTDKKSPQSTTWTDSWSKYVDDSQHNQWQDSNDAGRRRNYQRQLTQGLRYEHRPLYHHPYTSIIQYAEHDNRTVLRTTRASEPARNTWEATP